MSDHADGDAIERYLQRYPDSPVLRDVLGTTDAAAIRELAGELDAAMRGIFAFGASVGAVFGIIRDDGSRVAMKVNKRFADEAYFAIIQKLQARMREAGFPAPVPLGHRGAVVWEEWLANGAFRDAHVPDVRRAMARELARFHSVATATGLRPHRSFLMPTGMLWPEPHNALFDFDATTEGAEWIDEIGSQARNVPVVGSIVVGHQDWASKHVRFSSKLELTALYDWDSVTTGHEASFVGSAAASFTFTHELDPPPPLWPTADEALAFIDDYESERGRPFTTEERATAVAACVYLRAYSARCSHAYNGDARELELPAFANLLQ